MNKNQFLGCLFGGAIGDALGAPLEFLSLSEIRRTFGATGLTNYSKAFGKIGAITDDTQMMLFTHEGLLRALTRWQERGICHVPSVVFYAYQRWLSTQGEDFRKELPGFVQTGWLIDQRVLHAQRVPGRSCTSALFENTKPPSYNNPVNDSKGCGGLMRIAPVGLIANEPFRLGVEIAALTHGHPSGYLAAGFFAQVVSDLGRGIALPESIVSTLYKLKKWDRHEETVEAVENAMDLALELDLSPEAIESLGEGWVAEEALAIALYCALVADDYKQGVLLAVNHSGDSDSTGLMAGNLLGMICGFESIPSEWIENLEVKTIIEQLAHDTPLVLKRDSSERGEECRRLIEMYPPN